MNCEFGFQDCMNADKKCHLCTSGFYYLEAKKKAQGTFGTKRIVTKETSRQGSVSEAKNAKNNSRLLTAVTTGTPNSGAGSVKGDEQIRGIINIMEEVKTTTRKNIMKDPGKETFTIQKLWMEKLKAEAAEARMEFSYLKFSFKENDEDFYIIVNQDVIMDMVVTMVHDRLVSGLSQSRIDVAETRARLMEAENVKLAAEVEYLKAQLRFMETTEKNHL